MEVLRRDRLAGKLLIYTVQRRRTVALARQADFEPAGDNGGLWKIPALHRKTASVRARRGIDPGAHSKGDQLARVVAHQRAVVEHAGHGAHPDLGAARDVTDGEWATVRRSWNRLHKAKA